MDAVLSRYAHPESRAGQRSPLSDDERTGLSLLWAHFIFEAGPQLINDAAPSKGTAESKAFMVATGAIEEENDD